MGRSIRERNGLGIEVPTLSCTRTVKPPGQRNMCFEPPPHDDFQARVSHASGHWQQDERALQLSNWALARALVRS
jgi:hypothetical protein